MRLSDCSKEKLLSKKKYHHIMLVLYVVALMGGVYFAFRGLIFESKVNTFGVAVVVAVLVCIVVEVVKGQNISEELRRRKL